MNRFVRNNGKQTICRIWLFDKDIICFVLYLSIPCTFAYFNVVVDVLHAETLEIGELPVRRTLQLTFCHIFCDKSVCFYSA